MLIGIPKEIMADENRVAATPETVKKYIQAGHHVLVEALAGKGIFRSDSEYEQAGAEIVLDATEVFSRADVVLKVKQPEFNERTGKHEIDMLNPNAILITFLHPAAPGSRKNVEMLQARGITALTMDGIPRTSRAQRMDALSSMGTVTGYKSVIIAASNLPKFIPMIGTAIGTTRPAQFLIIGTGVVGLQAVATARRLGAVVRVVDIREDALKEAESLGAKAAGFEVPAEVAKGEGGYAKSLSKEWLDKEHEFLRPIVAETDVIILSALVPGETAPILITPDMVNSMQPGSVIIDVSVDQGGNCALTDPGCDVVYNGVKICGLQNIPGRMAVHSTWLYANNMFYYFENAFKQNGKGLDLDDDIVGSSLVTLKGKLVHQGTLKALGQEA